MFSLVWLNTRFLPPTGLEGRDLAVALPNFDIVLATELLGGLDGGGVVVTVEKYRLYEVTIAPIKYTR